MSTPNIGAPALETGTRDAIHIAVISAKVRGNVYPGMGVGIHSNGDFSGDMPAIGVVDPFLPFSMDSYVDIPVWIFLKPNTVHTLTHTWKHPSIPEPGTPSPVLDPAAISPAEIWLRAYAVRVKPYLTDPEDAFQSLIGDARNGSVFFSGRDCHSSSDVDPLFFEHISAYLGQTLTTESFEYGCSC